MTEIAAGSATITVSEALALPELVAGDPEVVVAPDRLDRRLRWAHVVAGTGAAPLLDGDELVLTTGAGWPTEAAPLADLTAELVATGPAAFVFELGTAFPEVPAPLVRACERAGVPLIVLHRVVRFVQITQRIHQRLLAAQSEELAARSQVHAMLTELGLNRSPVDYVVERLSETLDAPVVLEDSAGDVVAWAGSQTDRGGEPVGAQLLAPWAGRARGEGSLPSPRPEGWDRVPVEAQGRRWGALTALPGPAHPAGRRTVLELGAFALALGRLVDPEGSQWLRLSSKRVFDVLLGGRYRRDEELETQLAASGLPIAGRVLFGATLRGTGDFGAHASLERAVLETALRRAIGPDGRVILASAGALDGADPAPASAIGADAAPDAAASAGADVAAALGAGTGDTDRPALIAILSFPADDPLVRPTAAAGAPPPLAAALAREVDGLLPSPTPAGWRAHLALGAAGQGLRSLIVSLERVRAAGRLTPVAGTGRVTVQQAERQALAYLVRGLTATPEMQEFAADALAPLIAHDAAQGTGHSGDLVRVLAAYLEHPTNRSLAAQHARLSRSVFYQRLALIEDLLGVDLASGTVIATLTVALLAQRRAE